METRKLNSKLDYRCLAIGRSHGFLGKSKEALALFAQASKLASNAATSSQLSATEDGPPRLDVSRAQAQTLTTTLRDLVAQYRGLVTLEKINADGASTRAANERPVVERLHKYSGEGSDLNYLVPTLPQLQPVPVKPLFLDVAWNYVSYPREGTNEPQQTDTTDKTEEKKSSGRRGWFGFGR